MQEQIVAELQEHQETIASLLQSQTNVIEQIAKVMVESYATGNKVVLFGNGGSAADAQHIAAEFMGRYKMDRKAMASLALTTNSSIVTAIGNDFGYEHVFERQVEGLVHKGDVAIGITTSGNAENVKLGLQRAKEQGATTIAFVGKNMGKLQEIKDSIDIFFACAFRKYSKNPRSSYYGWTYYCRPSRKRTWTARKYECKARKNKIGSLRF